MNFSKKLSFLPNVRICLRQALFIINRLPRRIFGASRNDRAATWIIFITVPIIFLFDRISKIFISNTSFGIEKFNSGGGSLFSITKVYNTGAAFGILKGQTFFLSIFSFLVIISLFIYIYKKQNSLKMFHLIGIGMILGGTAGNLYDRIVYGYVIDFIKLNFIDFPIFNIADLFINIGIILIFLAFLIPRRT